MCGSRYSGPSWVLSPWLRGSDASWRRSELCSVSVLAGESALLDDGKLCGVVLVLGLPDVRGCDQLIAW